MIAETTDFAACSPLPLPEIDGADVARLLAHVRRTAVTEKARRAGLVEYLPGFESLQDHGECEEREIDILPGPKKKQAEALFQNVNWLVEKFGAEFIGFLTITMGEFKWREAQWVNGEWKEAGWVFFPYTNRETAAKEWNKLVTGVLKKRYHCCVAVAERDKNRHIHYHLITVCNGDIKTGLNYDEVFPPKGPDGKEAYPHDYRSAGEAIKEEWEYWRKLGEKNIKGKGYKVGRCQMQPLKKDGEAVGRYLAKYITKQFIYRQPEDKGWRMLRYIGNWSTSTALPKVERISQTGEVMETIYFPAWIMAKDYALFANIGTETWRAVKGTKFKAPWSGRFSWTDKGGRLWREMLKQIGVVCRGNITPDNVKELCGPTWAYRWAKTIQHTLFYDLPDLPEDINRRILEHNANVEKACEETGAKCDWIINKPIECWMPDPYYDSEITRQEYLERVDHTNTMIAVAKDDIQRKTKVTVIGGIIHAE